MQVCVEKRHIGLKLFANKKYDINRKDNIYETPEICNFGRDLTTPLIRIEIAALPINTYVLDSSSASISANG